MKRIAAAAILLTLMPVSPVLAQQQPGLDGLQTDTNVSARKFDCVVEPSRKVKLGSPVAGLLREVTVGRGAVVRKGQVVARMRDDLERATVALNAARARGNSRIDAERARLKLAQGRLKRAEQLLAKQIVPAERVDELRAETEIGVQNVRREKQEKQLAQLELDRSKIALQQRSIKTPIDGVVTQRLLSPGEYVHQEAFILEIAGLNPLHIKTYLPVSYYGQVAVGQVARVGNAGTN